MVYLKFVRQWLFLNLPATPRRRSLRPTPARAGDGPPPRRAGGRLRLPLHPERRERRVACGVQQVGRMYRVVEVAHEKHRLALEAEPLQLLDDAPRLSDARRETGSALLRVALVREMSSCNQYGPSSRRNL